MPIARLEYETNEWDGLGQTRNGNSASAAEKRAAAQAKAAAAKQKAAQAAAARAAATPTISTPAPATTPVVVRDNGVTTAQPVIPAAPQTVQELSLAPTAVPAILPAKQVAANGGPIVKTTIVQPRASTVSLPTTTPAKAISYQFFGVDITALVTAWNDLRKKLGLGQTYKTNEWDGTINELAGVSQKDIEEVTEMHMPFIRFTKFAFGQKYETNQWDGTISELEKRRR